MKNPNEMTKKINNPKIIVVSQGFYYFGDEVQGPDGYIALKNAAMFGGFSGAKGLPSVARGDSEATVNLDRFIEDSTIMFPLPAVLGILPCVNLYEFKGTTLR